MENEQPVDETAPESRDDTDGLKLVIDDLSAQLKNREDRIAVLENSLAEKDRELARVHDSVDAAVQHVEEYTAAFQQAVTAYRELAGQANPGLVAEMIKGDTIAEVDASVKSARLELGKMDGTLSVELHNDTGAYAFPGQGALDVLEKGCQIEFSPGYKTPEGNEYSSGLHFMIDSLEHVRYGGKASLVIRAQDGWRGLENWQARRQFRWNKSGDVFSVKDILSVILAKAGLRLEVVTQSAAVTGFYPDFTVNPGNSGKYVIQKLLGFVPDSIFIEGNTAFLVDLQAGDPAVYYYGTDHVLIETRFRQDTMAVNRVQAEGWDAGTGNIIVVDSCAWDEIDSVYDRFKHVTDKNLNTVAEAGQRGVALLRQAEVEMETGVILTAVNCGQQLLDVVTVMDPSAGLNAAVKRVLGITLVYNPARAEYLQRVILGKV